jgi:hypothetical protein
MKQPPEQSLRSRIEETSGVFEFLKNEIPLGIVLVQRNWRRFVIGRIVKKPYVSVSLVYVFCGDHSVNDFVIEIKVLVENGLDPIREGVSLLLIVNCVIVTLAGRRYLAPRLDVLTQYRLKYLTETLDAETLACLMAARSLRRLHYHQQRAHMFGIESWPHHQASPIPQSDFNARIAGRARPRPRHLHFQELF